MEEGGVSLERWIVRKRKVERLAAFFFAAQQQGRRYFVELDWNVQNGAGCICIS